MDGGTWTIREEGLDEESLVSSASRFAVANGWLGVRGVLDEEGLDAGPGTLLAGVYDVEDHSYTEPAYGYPEVNEQLVPVVDAWRVAWSVDGEPVDLRTGTLEHHERVLDLRRGLLGRTVRWRSPRGAVVVLRNQRFVSLARREVVASSWEVEAVDDAVVVAEPTRGCHAASDGHAGARVLTEACGHEPDGSRVAQRTTRTGIGLAVRTRHVVEADPGVEHAWRRADPRGIALEARLRPGERLRLAVIGAYSVGEAPAAALDEEAARSVTDAEQVGWDGLLAEHGEVLESVWERGDVVVEGDDVMQRAIRFAVFHVAQASAQVAGVGVRAKGLTGLGYHGHTFWDSECFILPVLDHVLPSAAAAHLEWRRDRLGEATERARELGLPGAAFPWRTISGRESSGYWLAGTAAMHVSADVTLAAVRHAEVADDEEFARDVAAVIAVATARMWMGRGHDAEDGFHVDGVTGPDEYTALVDDNAYTNLLVRRNLRAAAALTERFGEVADALDVSADERAAWVRAAERVVVPYDDAAGVTEQDVGFTRREPWDFEHWEHGYPLADHAHFMELYRHQVVKQADVVMAHYLAGEDVSVEQKRRDVAYYEPLTVRDSSLSAPAQAVVAAEVGYGDLAWDYTRECALLDLWEVRGSTRGGVHVASLAGAWSALVAGFGGLRVYGEGADGEADDRDTDDRGEVHLHLAPRLPRALTRLVFRVHRGAARVEVEVRDGEVTYSLLAGDGVVLAHHGERLRLTADEPVVRAAVPAWPDLEPPRQPPGREPGPMLERAAPGSRGD